MKFDFINWKRNTSVIRAGNFVLMNQVFGNDLYYQVLTGGKNPELFPISTSFDHSQAVSSLVSSRTCIPSTDGKIIIGDKKSVIDHLDYIRYTKLKQKGIIDGGMVPKIDNCFDALKNGVKTVKIGSIKMINSNIPHTKIVI